MLRRARAAALLHGVRPRRALRIAWLAVPATAWEFRLRVALIRHLPPLAMEGRCYGRLEVAACPATEAELAALRGALAPLHAPVLWTSPARRCRELAEMLGITACADLRLLELDFGAWEGLHWDAVPRDALDRWAADPAAFTPPGGEAMRDFVARVGEFAAALRRAGRDAVVVSHGGPLRLLPALLRGEMPELLAPAPAFGTVTLVTCQPDTSSVSTAHSAS